MFDDHVKMHPEVSKFLNRLEKPAHAKAQRLIDLLIEKRKTLGMPFSKKIASGLYELRVAGIQNVRILYAFSDELPVLLYAFAKKRQKLARRDIDTALQRLETLRDI